MWNRDLACWLREKGSRLSKPSAWGNFTVSPALSTRPTMEAEQDHFICRSTGRSSGNCQKMETCMGWACHMQWQLLWALGSRFLEMWRVWHFDLDLDQIHQFSPLTSWVIRGSWGLIQQRSFSSLFCRRPLWAVLAWAGISTLECCPNSQVPKLNFPITSLLGKKHGT